jgi:non-specific serine/threonine protein kinase
MEGDAPPHNLPAVRASLIGREADVTAACTALRRPEVGLLTLAGPGGVGKTRLALAIATALLSAYPDGVWLVELAPLADPTLVPGAIAAALGVRAAPRGAPDGVLAGALRERRTLLVLDNCEHLLDAVATLADTLLAACPYLRFLATSREPLRLPGEQVQRVAPLPPPDAADAAEPALLARNPAVALFLDRARARRADFALTPANAPAVAEICRRLDGIPLALELAAVRAGALPVQELAARLDDALRLLTGGARTAPTRQQTLRAALDWSHALLTPAERDFFRALAVFAGAWTLAASEAVCAGHDGDDGPAHIPAADALDLLAGLVERSLVVAEGEADGGRYRLLEPVRQYAAAHLAASDAAAAVRARHARFYLAVAERAGPELHGAEQTIWLERLERDADNLRAALTWEAAQGGPVGVEAGLRFGYALWPFWWIRGDLREGRGWLAHFLRAAARERTLVRSRALFAAGRLATLDGDYRAGREALEEGLGIARGLGHEPAIAGALTQLGHVALQEGDYDEARARYGEALAIRQARGDRRELAISYTSLGHAALAAGDVAAARDRLARGHALYQEVSDEIEMARAQCLLGDVALAEGKQAEAREHYLASLERCRQLGHRQGVAYGLEGLALAAASALSTPHPAPVPNADAVRAVRALGAVAALAVEIAVPPLPARRVRLRRFREAALATLGHADYEAAHRAGEALTLNEAIAEVTSPTPVTSPVAPRSGAAPAGLSRREVEVLRLLASGGSNREIADILHLSVRTVERHVDNLYGKIGAHGRADATAFALRQHLVPDLPA